MKAEIIRHSFLSVQACVPSDWTDEQVIAFAETDTPCGTEQGWYICKQGCEALGGMPERNLCSENDGFVHLLLQC